MKLFKLISKVFYKIMFAIGFAIVMGFVGLSSCFLVIFGKHPRIFSRFLKFNKQT